MKKNLLLIAALSCSAICMNAQWTVQNTAYAAPKRAVRSISIVDQNKVWIASSGTVAGARSHDFSRTTDGGATWHADSIKTLPQISPANSIANICAVGQDTAWAAMYGNQSTSTGGIFYTTNGGLTWTQQTTAAFKVVSYPDFVYFYNKNNGIAFGDPDTNYFEIYTTSNGGTTWARVDSTKIPLPIKGEYGNVNGFAVAGGTLWAGTSSGRLLKTTDKGLTWTAEKVFADTTMTISRLAFKDATHGLATVTLAAGDTMMRTSDGGTTWTPVKFTGRYMHAGLCYAPGYAAGKPGMYICTGSSAAKKGTSYSLDDGTTWVKEDTAVAHTIVSFYNTAIGWAGGSNTSATVGGIFKWSGDVMAITENHFVEGLSVYPNPNDGHFQIALKDASGKPVQVSVYDLTGKVVYRASEGSGNASFVKDVDLSSSPKGLYFVQILDGTNVTTRKIVIE